MRTMGWLLSLVVLTTTSLWGQLTPQPDKDGVYTAGKGLTVAKLVHAVAAVYPSEPSVAQTKHICAFRVVVGPDGVPGSIQLLNEHASPFDVAALVAVKQSQFEPASYKGDKVPTYRTLWVPFNVDKESPVPIESSADHKGISAPAPLNSVEAEFPKGAPKGGVVVLVRALVTEEGLPADIRLIRAVGHGFDENALKAVGKYRFRPATFHGVPVPFEITVEVNFRSY